MPRSPSAATGRQESRPSERKRRGAGGLGCVYRERPCAKTLKLPNEANVFGVLEVLDELAGQGVGSSSAPICHMALFCQNDAKIGFVWGFGHQTGPDFDQNNGVQPRPWGRGEPFVELRARLRSRQGLGRHVFGRTLERLERLGEMVVELHQITHGDEIGHLLDGLWKPDALQVAAAGLGHVGEPDQFLQLGTVSIRG